MLSIIIPTLNEEKYLPLLLEQIKKQKVDEHSFISTHRSPSFREEAKVEMRAKPSSTARVFNDLEIIVADAGSEDRTVEIAKSYGCKIVKGGSPAKGRNEGTKIAQGDIFLFMDADNIYLPENFLENLLNEFEKRDLKVATFPIYPNGNGFDKFAYRLYNWWVQLVQNFSAYATNSVLVKKEVYEKIGGFDEEIKIGEDHYFAKMAKKFGKFGFIKTEPVLTSIRRFERDGRFKTYLKYFLAGIHMIFLGPVKTDIFKYRFNHLKNSRKEL